MLTLMSTRRSLRLVVFAPLLALVVSSSPADAWGWPLQPPHQVLAGFVAPLTPYSAGHRGIDLAAAPSDPVFAPSDGQVSFVGFVVDRPVVSIVHAHDIVSTVEPVDPLVAVGDRVVAGQRVGTVAVGGHCGQRCLHFGVREHGRYVSPLRFLGGVPRAVLLPLG
ncbi:M23 family metallopeptidase [Cryobacterium sp. CG_9.6]|uniref:M23 family metallopeptidase n=1 Tax=Cryobacterium sp. CG_9.6 TaxID=2760710 RepID=UPI0024754FA7|nr:M23 family metallopeptidase [Cryobacterium sp. CG_9.6]MDH6237481.1 murein DD-endopeptidase MepM/ murein hydrolase activator NlpD [Cryobacterium sp. CG_9.6]